MAAMLGKPSTMNTTAVNPGPNPEAAAGSRYQERCRLRLYCNMKPKPNHRPLSSSFLGLPYRILNMNHKKELLRGPWVTWFVVQHMRDIWFDAVGRCLFYPTRTGPRNDFRFRAKDLGLGFRVSGFGLRIWV